MRIKTVIFLLAICANSLCVKAQSEPVDFEVNEETKTSVLLTFETIRILDSISEKIWPGWNAEKLAYFMGAKGEYEVFVNPHFAVPEGFKKNEELSIDGNTVYMRRENDGKQRFGSTNLVVLDGKIYRASATHRFPYNWPEDALITAKMAAAFDPFPELYHNTIVDLHHAPEFFVSIQIHEGFHVYQYPKIRRMRMKTIDPTHYFNPKVMVYSYIEGMTLLEALQTNNEEDLLKMLHKFISVRKTKNRHLSKRRQKAEQEDEFTEGTAQYVQTMSQIMLQKLHYKPQAASLQNLDFDKAEDFKLLDSVRFISSIRRYNMDEFWNKCYFYGQAQAYILDRLCGDAWKPEVMEGDVLLWDLILKYSGYDKNSAPKIEDIKAEYEYSRLLKAVKKMDKKAGDGVLR